MYKIIALDLDDTLLNDDLTISAKNIEAIKAMEALGMKIILCSGRAKESMMPFVKTLNIHGAEDFIISYNGALINTFDGKEYFSRILDGNILKELIQMGREAGITTQLYNEDYIVEALTERALNYQVLSGLKPKLVNDLMTIPYSIKVLFNHEPGEELENLRLNLINRFGSTLNIFYSKPAYVEVLHLDANKGKALAYLASHLGIKKDEVIAIGDGFNDVSMIQYAGLGVAVGNAPEGVKKEADYVTLATNNEDPIYEVYQRFISNK